MDPTHDAADPSRGARPRAAPFRATGPGDLVAFAPIALGFLPTDSVVMLTFPDPGQAAPQARLDLPRDRDDVPAVVAVLLEAALTHRVPRVAFLVYDPVHDPVDDPVDGPGEGAVGEVVDEVVDEVAAALAEGFGGAGIEVVASLRVHDGHWFPLEPGRPRRHLVGVPCDLESHPFTAQAVVEGRVVLASRDEVRHSIAPDVVAVAGCREALETRAPLPGVDRVAELVRAWEADATRWDDAQAVGVAGALASGAVRDRLWRGLDRARARRQLDLWRDLVRRLPDELVAPPAAVLGFVAWLAGDGALAWCAVDRCTAVEPDHPLARLVSELLTAAVAPRDLPDLPGLPDSPGAGEGAA